MARRHGNYQRRLKFSRQSAASGINCARSPTQRTGGNSTKRQHSVQKATTFAPVPQTRKRDLQQQQFACLGYCSRRDACKDRTALRHDAHKEFFWRIFIIVVALSILAAFASSFSSSTASERALVSDIARVQSCAKTGQGRARTPFFRSVVVFVRAADAAVFLGVCAFGRGPEEAACAG